MLKEHKKSFQRLFLFLDFQLIFISLCIAYYLRFGLADLKAFDPPLQFKIFFFSYLVVWYSLSRPFQLYASKRFAHFWQESLDVCKATIICSAIATVLAFWWREDPLSRLFLLYFWHVQTGSLILFRFFVRKVLRYIRLRGYNFRQVLIVGRNPRAEDIARRIQGIPGFGVRILGCIDHPENENSTGCNYNFNLMGKLEDLEIILKNQVVDEVIITLPIKSFYSEIEKILSLCERVGVEVKVPTDIFSKKLARSRIIMYYNFQMIDFYTSPKMDCQLMVKRIMDISISLVLLIILSPLFLLISIIVKATSKGPVFFVQQRVGYNGRLFNCLKFRTMVENAEDLKKDLAKLDEMVGPVFKIKNDPRVTKVGRFLRKTSIDELPQLINVLKGDMSLVGPRPPVPVEVSQYELSDIRRLSMRPGITCTWQVRGRNTIPFDKWMELDRQYIDNWSLWMDIKILARTIPAVIRGTGVI